jgi:hypothetical protein
MGKRTGVHRVLVGTYEGRKPLGRPTLDGRIILKCIFEKWIGRLRLHSSGSI